MNPTTIYLDKVHRQEDDDFVKILNNVRIGDISEEEDKVLSSLNIKTNDEIEELEDEFASINNLKSELEVNKSLLEEIVKHGYIRHKNKNPIFINSYYEGYEDELITNLLKEIDVINQYMLINPSIFYSLINKLIKLILLNVGYQNDLRTQFDKLDTFNSIELTFENDLISQEEKDRLHKMCRVKNIEDFIEDITFINSFLSHKLNVLEDEDLVIKESREDIESKILHIEKQIDILKKERRATFIDIIDNLFSENEDLLEYTFVLPKKEQVSTINSYILHNMLDDNKNSYQFTYN
jgi:hypothetical protein